MANLFMLAALFADGSRNGGGAGGVLAWLLMTAGLWMVFTKAGEPGWAAIIPIYNLYVLCRVAGKSGWWLLLFLVPLVNFVAAFLVLSSVAERFGKGFFFTLGMIFLPFLFFPILGFGSSTCRAQP